ncbi:hypothetical protein ACYOEI_01780 [Singulisphaera rosea]
MFPEDAVDLIHMDVDFIMDFIESNRSDVHPDNDFHWHFIADSSGFRANHAKIEDKRNALSWAKIAVTVYDLLGSVVDPPDRFVFRSSAVAVRSNMILRYGPMSGDAVLDPKLIEDWFFGDVGLPFDEARRVVNDWASSTLDVRATVYIAIEMFDFIKPLLDRSMFHRIYELNQWGDTLLLAKSLRGGN